jgi:diacylglycerol kinase (ATP)
MKLVQVIHNPRAGEGKYNKDELKALLKKNGYECRYFSTKEKGWKTLDHEADLLLIAGGDGTIRKSIAEILKTPLMDRPGHLAILPLGTANNISKALNIQTGSVEAIRSWRKDNTKSYDVGRIFKVPDHHFFLESFGFGVFPFLMKEMQDLDKKSNPRKERLDLALKTLYDCVISYPPQQCHVTIDGKDHSGKFILAEVMNTGSIGPNLKLSPDSDPGDGLFEVILITEKQRAQFAGYIAAKLNGKEKKFACHRFTGKNIRISCESPHIHIDDELVKLKENTEVSIRLKRDLLSFLV